MARFEVLYNTGRSGLDKVIEADTYKVDAKFFTFLKDKEVVRSLRESVVVQVRRMADDEAVDDEEDDLLGTSADALTELLASSDDVLPADTELQRLLAEIPEVDLSGLPEFDADAILKSLDEYRP
ncbi:hypothetical protein GCM10023216_02700 [Isoptericola chiayiensis]|uniref:Uncharacterized protein n=1 Tax=Isoptericola chiayiensis TaxID=579446 RepID=A0ABP8Y0X5_9MICO|nr:hypothetical protein [Isoptericola chiayiensis]NOW01088.1 hypothetical protein [Isoptericola chiayiensis]